MTREPEVPDNSSTRLVQPLPARGIFRFSLLVLVAVVVLINLPFMTGHIMPGHDSKLVLGIFDYMYSNWLFSGELPHWMAYGLHGLDAAAFHISFMSASSYLALFVGKLLGVKDSLALFSAALCMEQLLFLLGFYLLSRRLFREPLTVFCICLTAVGLIEWQYQLFFNLRLFCLLPLAFYFILRVRYDGAGYCGWLAGIVAILGPEGFTYSYVLWALILAVFSLVVFWGRWSSLNALVRPRLLNILAALSLLVLALAFAGTLWHALDNFAFNSPGRDTSGKVSLATFLTYGGTDPLQMLSALVLPRTFMASPGPRVGMADYVGLIGLFCLPWGLSSLRSSSRAYPFAVTGVVILALSLGGVLASALYCLPGMKLFRHVGYVTGVVKVLVMIVAGFGFDFLIHSVRERKLIRSPTGGTLLVIIIALLFYVDLNIGGRDWAEVCTTLRDYPNALFDTLAWAAIYPLGRAALMFAFAINAWALCKSTSLTNGKSPKFTLAFLVICVIGDCVLFQLELYTHSCTAVAAGVSKFKFPADRLQWPIVRPEIIPSDEWLKSQPAPATYGAGPLCDVRRLKQVSNNIRQKYVTWQHTGGGEYQVALSCALQWDPPSPMFRAEWVANNVAEMQRVLGKVSTQELAIVSGLGGLKCRLLADASAIQVKTDQEALKLLGSRGGWDNQVIVTEPTSERVVSSGPPAASASRLELGEFSANSFSLSLSNGLAQPAWLIYADAYSPGWHAMVNGTPAPILSAYGAFRAVKVQPGISQVRCYYQAGLHSLCLNVFTALAACSVALVLLWLVWLIVREGCASPRCL